MMEEVGFKPGELDDILFHRLKRGEFLHRRRLKLELAVAALHAEEIASVKKQFPEYNGMRDENGVDVDVPVLSPANLYIVDAMERWKETRRRLSSVPKDERDFMVADLFAERARVRKAMNTEKG